MITETEFYTISNEIEDTLKNIKESLEEVVFKYFTKLQVYTKDVKDAFWLVDGLSFDTTNIIDYTEGGLELVKKYNRDNALSEKITEIEFNTFSGAMEGILRMIRIMVEDLDVEKGYFTKLEGYTKDINAEAYLLASQLRHEIFGAAGLAEEGVEFIDETLNRLKHPEIYNEEQ